MCGIAGIWRLNGEALKDKALEVFTDSFLERGPDGSGYDYFENNTLGLGHRRLSILDLTEAGHQPMYYLDRYCITYNGEIFNFNEIKRELESSGHRFKTSTDTEVVLAAYAEWGKKCLHKFNGMWAFAIWDFKEKELFLARDRFGIKPLYYTHQVGISFAFASETRAFKSLEGFQRTLDSRMLNFVNNGENIHGKGFTIYNQIYQILPGHSAVLSLKKGLVQTRWWDIRDHNNQKTAKNLAEQAEEFYTLFRDSCKLRMISDVSLGTALSGGLDSSSVYSVVNDITQKEAVNRMPVDCQRAFVATFPGLIFDERKYAEEALKFTGGPAVFLNQEYSDLPAQIEMDTLKFDSLNNMPITSVSGIYKGMKKAGITVSLDGHGVDEMLYGYRDMVYKLFYYYYQLGDLKKAEMLRKVLVPTYHETEQNDKMKQLNNLMHEAHKPFNRLKNKLKSTFQNTDTERNGFANITLQDQPGNPYDFSRMKLPDRMLYEETFTDTLPYLFSQFDLASMMNSVEIRMPFMDYRLVSYIFSLPMESKINGEFNKLILRESMKGRMAENIRVRKYKIGIGSPTEHWFKTELKDWVLDKFNSSEFRNHQYMVDNEFVDFLTKSYKNNSITAAQVRTAWREINLHIIND